MNDDERSYKKHGVDLLLKFSKSMKDVLNPSL